MLGNRGPSLSSLQIPFSEVLEREVGDQVEALPGDEGGFRVHKLQVLRERSQSMKAGEGSIGVKHVFVFKESLLVAVFARGSTEVLWTRQPNFCEICGKIVITSLTALICPNMELFEQQTWM